MTHTAANGVEQASTQGASKGNMGWRRKLSALRAPALSPGRRVQLVILLVLLGGMVGTGWWLGRKIEERVLSNTVRTNQLYVDSLITPAIQNLRHSATLPPEDVAAMDDIISSTPLGAQVSALVLWGEGGQVIYTSGHHQIGDALPIAADLAAALAGELTWEVTDAIEVEHLIADDESQLLLELYSPVRDLETGRVLAVAEFYQPYDPLAADIAAAQREMWLVVGLVTALVYLVLAGFVEQASATIARQQTALKEQVEQLTELLSQNDQLYDRMQRATHSAATINERVLRRISADLHDGPAQYLGAMALHMDRITRYHREHPDTTIDPHVTRAQSALARAVEELRGVAAGLGVPQIESMPLDAVIAQVVGNHEQLTNTRVTVTVHDLPEQASTAIKVTVYRVLQEALSNAYRHGKGVDQRVEALVEDGVLGLLVSDHGPGFVVEQAAGDGERLGLPGMRDRVESLGGHFTITSRTGVGTWVRVLLPVEEVADDE